MSESSSRFVWFDLMTSDMAAAAAFYEKVIGWKAADSGMTHQPYTLLFASPDEMVAGLMNMPPHLAAAGTPPHWMGHVSVPDVDAYAAKVQAAGGSIHRAPEDIPGIGRFSVVADPQGAAFVLFRGNTEAPLDEPDKAGHVGWTELHAGDLETAWTFYSGLFGWTKVEEVSMGPMGIYRTFATGGEMAVGGMMTKTPDTPASMWLLYFNVDGIDAAVSRAKEAGGTLLMGPSEVPGGKWVAPFFDPQGAMFAMVSTTR